MALVALTARGQDMSVYDDTLENGWVSYGWATLNYANTSPAPQRDRRRSSFTDPGTSYEAIFPASRGLLPGAYIRASPSGFTPRCRASNQLNLQATLNGNAQAAVPLSFTAAQVNHWVQETVTLSASRVANNSSFDGFLLQNQTRRLANLLSRR